MNKTTKYSLLIAGLATMIIWGCKKDKPPPSVPTLTTAAISNLSWNTATSGGTITGDGGAAITASGICWSKTNNTPTITDSIVASTTTTGSFTAVITNLVQNTTYYIRAFATNSAGTGYGNMISFGTTTDTTKVTFTYNGQSVTYGVVISPTTGRKWMDRNLGASRAATSGNDVLAYGDLFQWGRLADGHQLRTSDTTSVRSAADAPGNSKFILTINQNPNYDWRSPSNDNLWQGSHGINNSCPSGWHVPFQAEWIAETGIVDSASAYAQLKLTGASGFRAINGIIYYIGAQGIYWSSTPLTGSDNAYVVYISPTSVSEGGATQRGNGMSIRCIKD